MKQFATSKVSVDFPGINLDNAEQIDFVIKETQERDAEALVKARWNKIPPNSPVSYIEVPDAIDGVFSFDVPAELTSHFPFNKSKSVFLDTRVKMADGTVPETPIKRLRVEPTLFSEDYEEEGGDW